MSDQVGGSADRVRDHIRGTHQPLDQLKDAGAPPTVNLTLPQDLVREKGQKT